MATALNIREDRRVLRDNVSYRTVIVAGVIKSQGLMVDISPLGCMIRAAVAVSPGDRIAIGLPILGSRAAKVIWALGGRLGAEFVDPIPPATYPHLLSALPSDPPAWNEI